MAERSTIAQVAQVGVEVTPGTAVAATRRLLGIGFEPKIQGENDTFRPAGYKYPTISSFGEEWVEAGLSGRPSYNELPYLLASILKSVSPSQVNPAYRGYKWLFTPSSIAEDTVKTYTIEHGGSVRGAQFSYGIVNELGLKWSRKSIELDGNMLGQRLTDPFTLTSIASANEVQRVTVTGSPTGGTFTLTFEGQTTAAIPYNATAAQVRTALEALSNIGAGNVATAGGALPATAVDITFQGRLAAINVLQMTAAGSFTGGTTPAIAVTTTTEGAGPELPMVPVMPTQVDVYLDDSPGALGTTKLTRNLSGEFKIGSRFGPIWAVDSAKPSFAAHVETEPEVSLGLMLEADAVGMGVLTAARNSQTKYMCLKATGPTIGGAVTYLFQVDMAVQVKELPALEDSDGVYATNWQFTAVHDNFWGKAMEIQVVNTLPAL